MSDHTPPRALSLATHTHTHSGWLPGGTIFHSLGMQLTVWPNVPLNHVLLLFSV